MTFLSPPSSSSSATTTNTKPIHHLYPTPHSSRASTPNNPLPGPSTSASPAPAPSSTLSLPLPHKSHHHHKEHHGMRAHLAEFLPLPRHAVFDARLTIHQLWNVPLVSGDFAVKWKFQHVHRERGGSRRPGTPNPVVGASVSSLLHPPSTSSTVTTPTANSSGRQTPDGAGFLSTGFQTAFMTRTASGSGSMSGKGKGREGPLPMLNVHVDHDSERDSVMIPSGASMLSIPSTSEGSCSSPSSLSPRINSMELSGDSANVPTATSRKNSFGNGNGSSANLGGSSGGNGNGEGAELSHEARGRTPYVALRDHHVKFGQTVSVTVNIAIQRDTLELQPCELKLIVEQLSNPNDRSALQNPRLGVVQLNLAEYVDKGSVTRRHLLRESRTNATLQLTLELNHAGGETSYKAPPLQKGEVMAGVSALLEKSAVGGIPRPRPAYDRSVSRPAVKTHRRGTDRRDVFGIGGGGVGTGLGIAGISGLGGVGAGGGGGGAVRSKLDLGGPGPGSGTLKTTDNIIEAIFNPVPSSSPAPSPFTYYVAPKLPAAPLRTLSINTTNTVNTNRTTSSMGSGSVSVSVSGSTGVSGSGSGSGDVDADADVDTNDDELDLDPNPNLDNASILAPSVRSRTSGMSRGSRRSERSMPASFASVSVSAEASAVSRASYRSGEDWGAGKGREGDGVSMNTNTNANTDTDVGDRRASGSGSATREGAGASVGRKWWKRFAHGNGKSEGEFSGIATAGTSGTSAGGEGAGEGEGEDVGIVSPRPSRLLQSQVLHQPQPQPFHQPRHQPQSYTHSLSLSQVQREQRQMQRQMQVQGQGLRETGSPHVQVQQGTHTHTHNTHNSQNSQDSYNS